MEICLSSKIPIAWVCNKEEKNLLVEKLQQEFDQLPGKLSRPPSKMTPSNKLPCKNPKIYKPPGDYFKDLWNVRVERYQNSLKG